MAVDVSDTTHHVAQLLQRPTLRPAHGAAGHRVQRPGLGLHAEALAVLHAQAGQADAHTHTVSSFMVDALLGP